MYDLLIIGAGPAGIAAAIYAARYKLKALVVSGDVGGLVLEAYTVDNYPGFVSIPGIELAQKFREHAKAAGASIAEAEIADVSSSRAGFKLVDSKGNKYEAKSLILATGTRRRKLNIPGEEKFLGKGVSYCAVCDAPMFKNKTVAVVGGNDSAAMTALLLAKHAKKVYIIYRKEKIRADPITAEKVGKSSRIEVIGNANVVEVKGSNFVQSVKLDTGKELKLEGVFVEIGSTPSLIITHKLGVKTGSAGYITTDKEQSTNIPGVFAAGDATDSPLRQIITAAAQGAIAASSAYKYTREAKK